jgi:hypothetical protein
MSFPFDDSAHSDNDQSVSSDGRPTAKTRASPALVILVLWPLPVVSSTRTTLPTGNRRFVPLPAVTSYSPWAVTKICRRGVGCAVSPFQSAAAPNQQHRSGTAGFGCPTATSRRSFMGTANRSCRPQEAVMRPQRLQPESTRVGRRQVHLAFPDPDAQERSTWARFAPISAIQPHRSSPPRRTFPRIAKVEGEANSRARTDPSRLGPLALISHTVAG